MCNSRKAVLQGSTRALKFGVHVPLRGGVTVDSTLKLALYCEKLGYDSLWVGDHFFLPKKMYEEMGSDQEKPDYLNPWVMLAAMAAQTRMVTLGTLVSPIPFYQPSRLAKIVATLDLISNGRVILGAGAGWIKEEAVAYGIEWNKLKIRIEKMREGIEVIRKLWTETRATFKGKYYTISDAPFYPKPIQKPHPPILFGGSSIKILECVAEIGDGWAPDASEETFADWLKIRDLAEKRGRAQSKMTFAPVFKCNIGFEHETPEHWIEKIEKYVKNGANHIIIEFKFPFFEKISPSLKLFAEKVIPSFQSL